jgi:uncharacterized short protein YbdD (DUF466 family)
MRDRVARARRGLRWYLRQVTGEAKWDEYVDRCAREATPPMSRREFERHRAEHRESSTSQRCC